MGADRCQQGAAQAGLTDACAPGIGVRQIVQLLVLLGVAVAGSARLLALVVCPARVVQHGLVAGGAAQPSQGAALHALGPARASHHEGRPAQALEGDVGR